MTKFDELLDRLKGQQPELENPDEMVANIMVNLPDREVVEKKSESKDGTKGHAMLIALRIVTSAAAILLIGIFILVNHPVKIEAPRAHAHTIDFPQSSTLEHMYTRHLEASQNKTISYTQLKRMMYENYN